MKNATWSGRMRSTQYIPKPGDGIPMCNVCHKPVERIWPEYPSFITNLDEHGKPSWRERTVPTGEVIMNLECHGERLRFSNRRGWLV